MTTSEQMNQIISAQVSTRFDFPCMWSNDALKEEIITLNVGDLIDYMRKQDMMPDSLISVNAGVVPEITDESAAQRVEKCLGKWLDKYEYTPL